MNMMASQITSLTIVYSTVWSDANQRKHQSSALLAFVRGIHRGPVNSPHKWPATRKMFPFDDVIMVLGWSCDFRGANETTLKNIGKCFASVHYGPVTQPQQNNAETPVHNYGINCKNEP